MNQDIFHRGEQQAQQRWKTSEIWDDARKKELLWNEIPIELHSRLNNAPILFFPSLSIN